MVKVWLDMLEPHDQENGINKRPSFHANDTANYSCTQVTSTFLLLKLIKEVVCESFGSLLWHCQPLISFSSLFLFHFQRGVSELHPYKGTVCTPFCF